MDCKVHRAYNYPRYRILSIDGERYIFDMGGRSFWKILFPLFYWILPNLVYKVTDHQTIEKIKAPVVEHKNIGWQSVLGAVLALTLSSLLYPLVYYFNVESTPLISSIIVAIVFLTTLSVFFYINIRSKKKLSQVINLTQYPMKKLWIRPQSFKNFISFLVIYLFFLGFTFLSWGVYIQEVANVYLLFVGMITLCVLFLSSFITVGVGDTTVKFKDDQKTVV